jgi:hypothetical protein
VSGHDDVGEREADTIANSTGIQEDHRILRMPVPSRAAASREIAQGSDPEACGGMRLGCGQADFYGTTVAEPPETEKPRVVGAIRRIAEVAEHPTAFPRCHEEFARLCPGGRKDALEQAFRCAVIWRFPSDVDDEGAGAKGEVDGHNIAYTLLGYRAGEEELAGFLMHEMGHLCGIGGPARHHLADVLRLYCLGAGRREVGLRLVGGPDIGLGALLGYRRLVERWLSGRQQLIVGADLNFLQLAREAAGERAPGSLGGAMFGFRERTPMWGAERWGGITLYGELGAGAARFRVREAEGHPGATRLGPGVVVEVGARAEFYFPDLSAREGRRSAIALTAGYGLIVPLTPEAEQIHQLVFGVQAPF